MRQIVITLTGIVAAVAAVAFGGPASAATLEELVAGAKKESSLRVTLHPGVPPATAAKIGEAFNKRYGLSIDFKPDLTGRYSDKAAKGAIEHRSGVKPSYDVMVLNESAFVTLAVAGALEKVDGWEKMLPEGAQPETASPGPIAGVGFKCCDLYWGYSYNPDLMDKSLLPLSMRDLGNPAFKGKIGITLFASNVTYAIMKYDEKTLLDMAAEWGENGIKRLHPTAMAQRVSLGEFIVGGFQSTEQYLDAKEKGGKIASGLFKDFIPHGVLLFAARKNSDSPNAAKLFAVWTTGREAVKLMGEGTNLGSAEYGENEAIAIAQKHIKGLGTKPMSFFDSEENYEKLKWLASREGKKFTGQLVRAMKAGGN